MITGNNASKNASTTEYAEIRKFIGVASIGVLALNPTNARLRSFGWQIPEGAEEPRYQTVDSEGRKSSRLRVVVQINDLDDKPVIALDYWLRPDVMFNKDQTKCKIIDSFGRTAWGTKVEVQGHEIPLCSNGTRAKIASDYKPCHSGEEELVLFLLKYLNVTPLNIFDRMKQVWVPTKNPGHVTIDRWRNLCDGDVSEFAAAIAMQPENRVKVVLGVRTTDDNKTYQTFLPLVYIGNGALPERNTGEYSAARRAIDKYFENHPNAAGSVEFSAAPVREWRLEATEVKQDEGLNTAESDSENLSVDNEIQDLPFE